MTNKIKRVCSDCEKELDIENHAPGCYHQDCDNDDMDVHGCQEPNYLSNKIEAHVGDEHTIAAVGYGYNEAENEFDNVAIECETCQEVIVDCGPDERALYESIRHQIGAKNLSCDRSMEHPDVYIVSAGEGEAVVDPSSHPVSEEKLNG